MRIGRRTALTGILVLVALYLATGFYFVRADERGVVRWFGRVPTGARSIGPGMHYAPPWPICKVDRPRTTEVRRVYVGMSPTDREAIARGNWRAMAESAASDMLTGDVNILKTTMVVQYQVSNPVAYLFQTADPDRLVRSVVESILIEELAGMPVDRALTAHKAKLQTDTLTRSQAILDGYGCGVHLVSADLESIQPPRAIVDAFQEVVSAQKDGERMVDEAVAESNRILPQARGEAARVTEAALGYRETRLGKARGESARFLSLLAEYEKDPEILRRRLMLEKLETVLPRVRTYILDDKPGDPTTDVKIVESGRSGPASLPAPGGGLGQGTTSGSETGTPQR